MNLGELKNVIRNNAEKSLLIELPDGRMVPPAFHITEVGHVTKRFIDCGGQVRSGATCLLQTWLGEDENHRLTTSKLAKIFDLSTRVVADDSLAVEMEYEDEVISQYPVTGAAVGADAVTIRLGRKHTDCLAKELCIKPAAAGAGTTTCC